MRILSIQYSSYPDDSGGVYNVVYNLHKRLAERGHEIHLIVARLRKDLPVIENISGMKFYRISSFGKSSNITKLIMILLEVQSVVSRIVKKNKVDLIHLHNPLMGIGTYFVPQSWSIPKVYHFHSSWFQEERKEYVHRRGVQKPSLLIVRLVDQTTLGSTDTSHQLIFG